MGCGGSTARPLEPVPSQEAGQKIVDPPSQEELYDAARKADAARVGAILEAGAQPDAFFRGIAISRGIRMAIPPAA
jgi:hypothetical protein